MRVIVNKYIPFKGFAAINLFGFVFTREEKLSDRTLRHEAIHTAQMKELLYIPFYALYIIEYVYRLIKLRNKDKAYYAISFEREAHGHQDELDYLKSRKFFAMWR